MKFMNFKEWESLQAVLAKMTLRDANKYFQTVWKEGFDAARRKYGLNKVDAYVWEAAELKRVLRQNGVDAGTAQRIMNDLEVESHDQRGMDRDNHA